MATQNLLSDFVITKELGSGTYGKVYQVTNKKTNMKYAMKTYMEMHEKDGIKDDILVEIDILNRVNHPNVARLVLVGFEDHKLALILPLASMDLARYIKQNKPIPKSPSGISINIMYQMWCGLNYLHTNFIIHQDIKPPNVLLEFNSEGKPIPKIADYGLSCIFANKPIEYDPRNKKVTLWWRPPELLAYDVANKKGEYNEKIDIWAMGLVCFELLTNDIPVAGDTEELVLYYIARKFGPLTYEQEEDLVTGVLESEHLNDIQKQKITADLDQLEGKRHPNFRGLPQTQINFLSYVMETDPDARPSAKDILKQPIFKRMKCSVTNIEYAPVDVKYSEVYTQPVRTRTLEWLKALKNYHDLNDNVYLLTIDLLDRFASLSTVLTKDNLQMIAWVCLNMAAKTYFEDADMFDVSADAYGYGQNKKQFTKIIIDTEELILNTLNFKIFRPDINLLFPDRPIDDVLECYENSLVPSEIKMCVEPEKTIFELMDDMGIS